MHDFASPGVNPRTGWETRDAPEGDEHGSANELAEIRSAVEGLTASADERLGSLDTALTELRSRLDRTETVLRRPGGGQDQRQGAEVETRAFATFLRRGREALGAPEVRVLRVSDDTAGGYLAPDQFIADIQRNLVPFSPVRSVARVTNVSVGAVTLPKRTGGMTAQWVGEIQPRPETTVTFGQNRFEVREIACWVDVSNVLLEDAAVDIAAELAFEFAEEFGRAEGAAFVNGDGALRPMGFMADQTIPVSVSGSASAFTADNLMDLYGSVPAAYRANAVWAMNSNTLATARKMKDTAGTYLLQPAGLAGAPATTLLGRPVVEMPDMPDPVAGATPIVFGDFNQGYRIFDRIALSILRDPYSQATNGMTRFHGRRRVAGGVAKSEALRKLKIAAS
ncbi:phage major capsid protein [Roseomonas marmotae]|uniref:phage major capsid protein n=1 Tax=Roseomonas marmotae TaxID=2768161 RepID=UPI001AD621FF|nr:phage major capsid protein [Roseomonas marmotae]QTI79014.1 phage major capsid protein [Roseomonas marmotae]